MSNYCNNDLVDFVMRIDIVTDTFAPDVNGVAMTLGKLRWSSQKNRYRSGLGLRLDSNGCLRISPSRKQASSSSVFDKTIAYINIMALL